MGGVVNNLMGGVGTGFLCENVHLICKDRYIMCNIAYKNELGEIADFSNDFNSAYPSSKDLLCIYFYLLSYDRNKGLNPQ